MRTSIRLLLIAMIVLAWPGEGKSAKRRDVEITEIQSTRQEGTVGFTGVVKVTRSKPIKGLVIHFEFFDTQDALLMIQKLLIEEGEIQSGDEIDFDLAGKDVPRAVSYRVLVSEANGRELSVARGGPYPL